MVSCNTLALFNSNSKGNTISTGCSSKCSIETNTNRCNDTYCCMIGVSLNLNSFNVTFQIHAQQRQNESYQCKYRFLVDEHWFRIKMNTLALAYFRSLDYVPVTLKWVLNYNRETRVFGKYMRLTLKSSNEHHCTISMNYPFPTLL